MGYSLFLVGKQLLQASLKRHIDSPEFLDRINRMDRIVACRPEAGQAINHRLRQGEHIPAGKEFGPHRRFPLRNADACFEPLFRSGLTNHPVNPVNPVK
jgi:hypothetical protein